MSCTNADGKFTPGPWKWDDSDADDPVLTRDPPETDSFGRRVGILQAIEGGPVWDSRAELDVGDADKALIAAAPDLYAALEGIVGSGTKACRAFHEPHVPGCEWCAARAALKKARGET